MELGRVRDTCQTERNEKAEKAGKAAMRHLREQEVQGKEARGLLDELRAVDAHDTAR